MQPTGERASRTMQPFRLTQCRILRAPIPRFKRTVFTGVVKKTERLIMTIYDYLKNYIFPSKELGKMYIFPSSFEGNFLFFLNIEQTADFYAIFFFSHYLHND